ncbi:OsmC family peroxiredoxin [Mycolicibacterium neoaurum]|uniref:OsmC family peroxiredoxin n=1 Tax=Mycolicibacterium neoaurum TaxID=1795 RepID=UPI002670F727|nr:OsmC family peroxiredoxin [Mycolicibacterium neoaurum]MDO3401592.1 OsmC family peroxiredoxin [Mycolicibacterium neoaurum]
MSERAASADWVGGLVSGSGTIELSSSGQARFDYSLETRAADRATTTSPEELLAAAYASCYAMQLSALLDPEPDQSPALHVEAVVTQGGPDVDFGIVSIALTVRARGVALPGSDFDELAEKASSLCPIGRALAAVPVTLDAAVQG